MESLILVGLLYGLTIAVVVVDRARRRTQGRAAVKTEPSWLILLLLTVLLNVATLPYYFEQTRGTRLARYAGFGLFLAIFMIAFSAFLAVVVRTRL